MSLKQRSTTRPSASARAFSELDGILLDYVIDGPPVTPARPPCRLVDTVERVQRRRWSFERAAVRQSMKRETPWFASKDDKRLVL